MYHLEKLILSRVSSLSSIEIVEFPNYIRGKSLRKNSQASFILRHASSTTTLPRSAKAGMCLRNLLGQAHTAAVDHAAVFSSLVIHYSSSNPKLKNLFGLLKSQSFAIQTACSSSNQPPSIKLVSAAAIFCRAIVKCAAANSGTSQ